MAECSHEIVIHSLQAAPFSLWSSPVARPLKVRDAAALALHSSPGACTRLPVLCPVQAGMPLHLGLLLPNDLPHSGFFAIVDVRRLVSPPRPHFCMVRLPGTVDIKWLRGFLRTTFPEAPPCPWAFFDQDAMQCAIRPTARTHVITVLGPPSRRPGEAPFLLPALVDTLELLALRPGWFQASARYPGASALPAYAPRSLPIPGSGDVLRILPDVLDDDVVTLWDCSLEPLQELDCLQEVIVHSLVSSPTRTYISTLWRPDQVEAFLLQLLDVPQASLCWPTWAPCMAGDPLHLALVPLSLGDRFILVDARRVHPALDFGFWLIPAPAQLSRAELMATFLDGRNVAITPAGYRLNGVRMIADFSPPVGISLVTLQACSLGGLQCATYNLAALSRLPGFCAAYAGPLTSTTTTVPRGHLAHGVSTTTTTSGPPPVDRAALLRARPDVRGSFIMSLDGKMIRFHVVGPSGHVEIAATVRDVTVEAVMTQLCVQLLDANELLPGLLFQACDRIVSDTDWGFSVFLCCRPGDHAGLAWIDARPMGLAPFSVALPFVLDERSLQAACGVDIPFDACIAVCGIPWHGTPRALRHCDVVSIRANFHQLFTLPLAALNSRVAGFATMLVQQRGPDHAPTTRCFTVDSICANWQLVHLSSSLALCAEDVYQKCILVAADFPPFPVTIGARVSPVETEVNCWYQTWLKPMFGDRFWRSTGLVFGEYTVFFDGAICEGPQRPWIVCIGEDIDVIIAGPGGEGLDDWPAPEGWVARPIATVGPIGQAALQRSSGAANGLLHFDLPEGGEPLAASTSAADNYDRLNDPFLPSWSSISEDDEVVWVSWSAPPLDDAEATEDTVSSSASAGALTIVDSDPEHAAVMSLLQIRAAPVSVVDKSSRQSAAVAPFSLPTPCGRACLPMPARDPPCPHSGTLSLSVLLQDSVQSTGDSDVDNTGLA